MLSFHGKLGRGLSKTVLHNQCYVDPFLIFVFFTYSVNLQGWFGKYLTFGHSDSRGGAIGTVFEFGPFLTHYETSCNSLIDVSID